MGEMIITASRKMGDRWENIEVPADIVPLLFQYDGTETVISLVEDGRKQYYCGDFGTRDKYAEKGIEAGMFYDLLNRLEG